jgi:hypothetical protein
VSKSNI